MKIRLTPLEKFSNPHHLQAEMTETDRSSSKNANVHLPVDNNINISETMAT